MYSFSMLTSVRGLDEGCGPFWARPQLTEPEGTAPSTVGKVLSLTLHAPAEDQMKHTQPSLHHTIC